MTDFAMTDFAMTGLGDPASILPLSVESLVFEANGTRLLDRVSFTLPKNGITVIIGPNGAGKSLTLRLCHGLLIPTDGTVRWHTQVSSLMQDRPAGAWVPR